MIEAWDLISCKSTALSPTPSGTAVFLLTVWLDLALSLSGQEQSAGPLPGPGVQKGPGSTTRAVGGGGGPITCLAACRRSSCRGKMGAAVAMKLVIL